MILQKHCYKSQLIDFTLGSAFSRGRVFCLVQAETLTSITRQAIYVNSDASTSFITSIVTQHISPSKQTLLLPPLLRTRGRVHAPTPTHSTELTTTVLMRHYLYLA